MDLSSSRYCVNLINVSREAFNEKKLWKFSNFSTADPRNASSHWLQPDLDAPGCCLFSDDLILVVLRGDRDVFLGGISFWIF